MGIQHWSLWGQNSFCRHQFVIIGQTYIQEVRSICVLVQKTVGVVEIFPVYEQCPFSAIDVNAPSEDMMRKTSVY